MKIMAKVFRTMLYVMAGRMDAILVAYERVTPCIDQALVRRSLGTIQIARRIAATLVICLMVAPMARAYDRSQNPDRYPSFGLDVSSGKLPGILKDVPAGAPATDGGFVKGLLDIRVPISNAITLHAFGSSTGVNNNLQFSEGSEVGFGLRVYLQ